MNNLEKYNQFVSDINPTNANCIYCLIKICAFIDKLFSEDQTDLFAFLTHIIKNDSTLRNAISLTLGDNHQIPSVILDNDMALLIINLYADLEKIKINIEEQTDDIIARITDKEEDFYQNDSQVADIITDFKKKMNSYPLLTQNELIELHNRFLKGDEHAKELIIYHNLRLVFFIAKRYMGRGVPLEDLLQEGTIGLMKAVDKYSPEKGAFSTCATWWISQNIRRSISDDVKTFHLPVHVQKTIKRILKSKEKLEEQYPENPLLVISKVAQELGISESKVNEYLKILSLNKPERLDKSIYEDNDTTLGDFITADTNTEEAVFSKKLQEDVQKALKDGTLTEQEINIINLRLGLMNNEPKTLEEIGQMYRITRERVRQIGKKIITKLNSDSNFQSLKHYITDSDISDSEQRKLSLMVNPNERGLFAYFPPTRISRKNLFIIVGLLTEDDIKLIIRTFGEKLTKTPSSITRRIEILIKLRIPETYILYNKFITNLYVFLNCPDKEKIESELANLSDYERSKVSKLFNKEDFTYIENSSIPFKDIRSTFTLLNKIRIKFHKERIKEPEQTSKTLYFINKERLRKDLESALLDNLSIRIIELKYGLADGKEYSYLEISEKLNMDYKKIRSLEVMAFGILYGKNRFKIIDVDGFFEDEPLENLNIYKDLPATIDESKVIEKELSSVELKDLIEESTLTLLQKCFLKVRFDLPLENIKPAFLTVRDFFINPVGAANLTNSLLGKLFSTKYRVKIKGHSINQNKVVKVSYRRLSNYFSSNVVSILPSIMIFLDEEEVMLLKKAFGNDLSLSLNGELTSDEYQRLDTIVTMHLPEVISKFKRYQKGLLSFFSHTIRHDIISEIAKLDSETQDFIYQNFNQKSLKFIGNLENLKEHKKAFIALMEIENNLEESRRKMKRNAPKYNYKKPLIVTKEEMLASIRKSNLSSFSKEILVLKYGLLDDEFHDALEICTLANIPITSLNNEINSSLIVLYGPLITIDSFVAVDNETEKEVILKNITKFKSLPAYVALSEKINPSNQDIIFYIMMTVLSQNTNFKSLKKFVASVTLTMEEQRLMRIFNKEFTKFTDECLANLWREDKGELKEIKYEKK